MARRGRMRKVMQKSSRASLPTRSDRTIHGADAIPNRSITRLRSGPRQKSRSSFAGSAEGWFRSVTSPSAQSGPGSPLLDEEQRLLDEVARQVSLIVDRKETAAEQERLHAKLRHADRLATIGQLASGVAHELNHGIVTGHEGKIAIESTPGRSRSPCRAQGSQKSRLTPDRAHAMVASMLAVTSWRRASPLV